MNFLFAIPVVSLVIVLILSMASLFEFNRPRPMLEQIEEARHNHKLMRKMEMNLEYEMDLIGD